MPRLIDAEAFENYVFDEWQKNEISNGDWITFREWLKDQETFVEFEEPITKVVVRGVEFVPVVRCKECKHLLPNDCIAPNWWRICDIWRTGVDENEYCSHGERKEK